MDIVSFTNLQHPYRYIISRLVHTIHIIFCRCNIMHAEFAQIPLYCLAYHRVYCFFKWGEVCSLIGREFMKELGASLSCLVQPMRQVVHVPVEADINKQNSLLPIAGLVLGSCFPGNKLIAACRLDMADDCSQRLCSKGLGSIRRWESSKLDKQHPICTSAPPEGSTTSTANQGRRLQTDQELWRCEQPFLCIP